MRKWRSKTPNRFKKEVTLENDHTGTERLVADYDLHMPKSLTYPLPVAVLSIVFASFLFFLFRDQLIIAGVCVAICLVAGGAYVGISSMVKRFTDTARRLADRDRFIGFFPWLVSKKYSTWDAEMEF
jgi:hypothetical protein